MGRRKLLKEDTTAETTSEALYFDASDTPANPNVDIFFSSGCTLLDCVLGGGYRSGRMINVIGDSST